MSNLKNENPSRRKFLSLGLMGGAGLIAGKATAQTPEPTGETVKMLTPDGQLVEVDKQVMDAIGERKKANNESILQWTKAVK